MSKPKYKLSPPHGDRIYWQSNQRFDSRTEEISCRRDWFWRALNQEGQSDGHQ